MVVIRLSRADSTLMNSRPCEHCIGLMREVGIKTVSYSLDDASIITENVADMDLTQHTSIGYRFLRHKLYPDRFIDPKIERNEEQEREKQNKKVRIRLGHKKYYNYNNTNKNNE
jgi:hypothetical protein